MFCNNCGNEIPDNANFCQSCGSKINYKNDIERENALNDFEKQKCENVFKVPLLLVVLQLIAYICGLLTKNFSFNISSGNELFEFFGYNIFIIIAIILLIKKRDKLNEIFDYSINVILVIISTALLIGTIFINYFDINMIDNDTKIKIHQEPIETEDELSEEEFNKLLNQYEAKALEIWCNGAEDDFLFEEIIITETSAYRFMRMFLNDSIYSFYEIDFIKNGEDVIIRYDDVETEGRIISDTLELYMDDGYTIYADYIKKELR